MSRRGGAGGVVMPVGDPRRDDKVTLLPEVKLSEDELPPDLMGIAAMILGMVGMWMRYKVAAWGALFCLIASVANMKPAEMDFKTIAASATFSIMGLVMNYAAPKAGAQAAS